MKVFARVCLTIFLLCIVWHNAHWSVALSLTLQFIALELLGWRR